MIAEIVDWPKGTKESNLKDHSNTRLAGRERCGKMNSILSEYGFPLELPKRVEEEAEKIPLRIS